MAGLGPMDPMGPPGGLPGPMEPRPGITSGEPFPSPRPTFPSPTLLDGRRLIKDPIETIQSPEDRLREMTRWPRW